jgi:malate/lactate dehydrogenase
MHGCTISTYIQLSYSKVESFLVTRAKIVFNNIISWKGNAEYSMGHATCKFPAEKIHNKQQCTSKGQSEASHYVKMLITFKSFSFQVILGDYYYFGPLN